MLLFIHWLSDPAEYRGPSVVPEEPMLDPCIDVQTNYIKSKWVAERLFQIVADRSILRTNVIRVGLLSGGINGFWDISHWLPSIVQSGSYVGCLPEGEEVCCLSYRLNLWSYIVLANLVASRQCGCGCNRRFAECYQRDAPRCASSSSDLDNSHGTFGTNA